jgi:hypothetical protein
MSSITLADIGTHIAKTMKIHRPFLTSGSGHALVGRSVVHCSASHKAQQSTRWWSCGGITNPSYRENHQSGAIVQTGRCTGSLRDGHARYQREGTGQNTVTQRSGAAATTDEYLVRRERDNGPRGGSSNPLKKMTARAVTEPLIGQMTQTNALATRLGEFYTAV